MIARRSFFNERRFFYRHGMQLQRGRGRRGGAQGRGGLRTHMLRLPSPSTHNSTSANSPGHAGFSMCTHWHSPHRRAQAQESNSGICRLLWGMQPGGNRGILPQFIFLPPFSHLWALCPIISMPACRAGFPVDEIIKLCYNNQVLVLRRQHLCRKF